MAKKDQGTIDPATIYAVTVSAPFPFAGLNFGPNAEIRITGELLVVLLASDQADKVAGYTAA